MDYVINQDGHGRTYHANVLQLYREREVTWEDEALVAVVEEEVHDDELPQVVLPQLHQREDVTDVVVNQTLSTDQKGDVKSVLLQYKDVLIDVPGRTSFRPTIRSEFPIFYPYGRGEKEGWIPKNWP
ncbi:hypothetical protein Pcinc_001304 [Petrolisthes cinctipes]|uniref:Uncharacterized protein n=1 Tax=Petrolisthes cinctipes TaxID=88211 RepID=A0AAE1GN14_PETCI|nr:hypothetical protein Pcinc_001304 [Petrolisthes cinctipes]